MLKKNIVFVALTSYQMYVAIIYSNYIKSKIDSNFDIHIINIGVKVEINTSSFNIIDIPNLNSSIIKRVWQRIYWGGRLFSITKLKKVLKSDLKNYVFVFNDNEPITNKIIRYARKRYKNMIIIIEEGIGIYEKTCISRLSFSQKIRLVITTILGSPMKYSAIGDNKDINCAIVEKPDIYIKTGKAKSQKVYTQNKRKLFADTDVFLRLISQETITIGTYDVLFIGQPFDEFGNNVMEEEKYLEQVFTFTTNNKLRVLIKPHPREEGKKYSRFIGKFIEVCDNNISLLPIECLARLIHTRAVISFNSSAGINIANINKNIDCFFCYKIDDNKMLNQIWQNGYSILSDDIFKSKNENMFLPETWSELNEKLLISIRKKRTDHIEDSDFSNVFDEIDSILL